MVGASAHPRMRSVTRQAFGYPSDLRRPCLTLLLPEGSPAFGFLLPDAGGPEEAVSCQLSAMSDQLSGAIGQGRDMTNAITTLFRSNACGAPGNWFARGSFPFPVEAACHWTDAGGSVDDRD